MQHYNMHFLDLFDLIFMIVKLLTLSIHWLDKFCSEGHSDCIIRMIFLPIIPFRAELLPFLIGLILQVIFLLILYFLPLWQISYFRYRFMQHQVSYFWYTLWPFFPILQNFGYFSRFYKLSQGFQKLDGMKNWE